MAGLVDEAVELTFGDVNRTVFVGGPAPVPPALPTRRNDEDANDFVTRVSVAYRHGNIWATSSTELAVLLLNQVSGIESLRPAVRDEAIDILGRLNDAKVMVSPIPLNHIPQPVLSAELRAKIQTHLPKAKTDAPALKVA